MHGPYVDYQEEQRRLAALVAENSAELARSRDEWAEAVFRPGRADRAAAETLVRQLYRGTPEIVWCESPLELVEAAGNAGGGEDRTRELVGRSSLDPYVGFTDAAERVLRSRSGGIEPLRVAAALSRNGRREEQLLDAVWNGVRAECVGGRLHEQWANLETSIWNYGIQVFGGDIIVTDTSWCEYFPTTFVVSTRIPRFLRRHWALDSPVDELRYALATSTGGFVLQERVAFLSERHDVLERDEQGRLHCADGPAISWPGGFAVFAWHGIPVPRVAIEQPDTLDPAAILGEANVEVRRALIERVGYQRVLDGCDDARLVSRDDYGTLWRLELARDEPLVLVEVVNATSEQDGTRKHYFLRVPPEMRTAREAVAWTFDTPADRYDPRSES